MNQIIKNKIRIGVAMSGGIDSTISALLLKQKGYEVHGIFMKNWDTSDELGDVNCPITKDLLDMKEVCQALKIQSHEVVLFFYFFFLIFFFI